MCGLAGQNFGDSMNIASTKGESLLSASSVVVVLVVGGVKKVYSRWASVSFVVKRRRRSQSRMLGEEVEEEGNVDERNECFGLGRARLVLLKVDASGEADCRRSHLLHQVPVGLPDGVGRVGSGQ